MYEKYQIAKLTTFDDKNVYTAIIKEGRDEGVYRVKMLKQPIYEIATKKFSTSLFKQYCHEDDVIHMLPLDYYSTDMSILIHKNMLQKVDNNETLDLLKYFVFTNFGNESDGKSDRVLRQEKSIISEALESLRKVS